MQIVCQGFPWRFKGQMILWMKLLCLVYVKSSAYQLHFGDKEGFQEWFNSQ